MRIAALDTQPSATGATAKAADPRLTRAAHEFEASLMGELLKVFQQGKGLTGDDAEEGSGDALAGFATESLSRAISERGGFGIADRVLHELHRSDGKVAAGSSTVRSLKQS